MKKFASILTATLTLTLLLTACGGQSAPPPPQDQAPASTQPQSTEFTEAQAKELALAKVPGATEQDIHEFKKELDDGRLTYEGTIVYEKMEYEFEIDVATGQFRSWESESVFD